MNEIVEHLSKHLDLRAELAWPPWSGRKARLHGKEGSQMLVIGDHTLEGAVTIGGCADAQVIEAEQDVARSGRPQLLRVELGEEDALEIGLTCAEFSACLSSRRRRSGQRSRISSRFWVREPPSRC